MARTRTALTVLSALALLAGEFPLQAWSQMAAAAMAAARTPPPPIAPSIPSENDPPFDNNDTPLAEPEFTLISESGYRIQPDGTIRAPGALRPLGRVELQMDIEELQGRKRLKALLQLDLLFSKYGYKNLPSDALADVRRVARQNWNLLPERVRADLRQYFTGPELESMDHNIRVVRAPATWMPLEDMDLPSDIAWPGAPAPNPKSKNADKDSTPTTMVQPNELPAPQELETPSAPPALPQTPIATAATVSAPATPSSAASMEQLPLPPTPPATAASVATVLATTTPPPPSTAPSAPSAATTAMGQAEEPEPAPAPTAPPANAEPAPAAMPATAIMPSSWQASPASVIAAISQQTGEPVQSPPAPTAAMQSMQAQPAAATPPPNPPFAAAAPSAPAAETANPNAGMSPAETDALNRLKALEASEAAARSNPSSAAVPGTPAPPVPAQTIQVAQAAHAEPSFQTTAAPLPRMQVAGSAPAATPAQPAASTKPAAPAPKYRDVTVAAFNEFLMQAPYGHEAQSMLKLINEHAPADVRRQVLGYVVTHLPLVIIDAARTSAQMRVAVRTLPADGGKPAQTILIMNEGPLIETKKFMFLGSHDFLLPADPTFYPDRGASAPSSQAASSGTEWEKESLTSWGKERVYKDGSHRLRYGTEQMAGTLVAEIIRLDDAALSGGSDPYRLELVARGAQFMFYRKLKQDLGVPPVLDADLLTEYEEWINSPADYDDFVLESMTAPAASTIIPALGGNAADRDMWSKRADLAVLDAAGVEIKPEIHKLLDAPLPKDGAGNETVTTDEEVLQQFRNLEAPSPLLTVWMGQESKFRSEIDAPPK